MYEHAIYSVISPEGCASILWRDAGKAKDAANALKITAQDMKKFKIVDEIIPEPLGGAHRDPKKAILSLGDILDQKLKLLNSLSKEEIKNQKLEKYLKLDNF